MFGNGKTGELVPISGTDPVRGPWQHSAFLPDPLPQQSPDLTGARGLHVSYGRANQLVDSLVRLGILRPLSGETYNRRFFAPRVLSVLLETGS